MNVVCRHAGRVALGATLPVGPRWLPICCGAAFGLSVALLDIWRCKSRERARHNLLLKIGTLGRRIRRVLYSRGEVSEGAGDKPAALHLLGRAASFASHDRQLACPPVEEAHDPGARFTAVDLVRIVCAGAAAPSGNEALASCFGLVRNVDDLGVEHGDWC